MDDADKKVTWNAEALEVVCMTVIGCITPSSERRLSTINLLDLLKHAIDTQAGKSDVGMEGELVGPPAMERPGTDGAEGRLNRILSNIGRRNSESESAVIGVCVACNRNIAVVKCRRESHALCANCIDDAVWNAPPSTNSSFELLCLKLECSSQPFTYKDLCKHIHPNVWTYHMQKYSEQGFNEIK
ncbi:hypothetical protein MHU86_13852 [Fragilaria crotonensis]|nr:hypothetical protein MHU86_13852 [Fragilaria crotonensis]